MSGRPIDYLSVEDLLEIAVAVVGNVAIRDYGLLASAAGRPQSSAFGENAYPTFAEKAAALMHSLARNHALVDGNKRLAWSATRAFCLLNHHDLAFTVDDAEQFVLAVARGDLDVPDITTVLEGHLRQPAHVATSQAGAPPTGMRTMLRTSKRGPANADVSSSGGASSGSRDDSG